MTPGAVTWSAGRIGRAACLLLFAVLIHTRVSEAHVFLTEESLDDALGDIAEWHEQLPPPGNGSGDAEAIFRVGEAAWMLVDLMNEEVRVHGLGQQALMTEAIERASAYDVSIAWSEDHYRFFYDGDAFRRYLAASPAGDFAADSRYRLIELDFYLSASDSILALQSRAAEKRSFLTDYPRYPAGPRIGIFLGIDYRDLYRLCTQVDEADCNEDYGRLAVDQFDWVAAANPDSDSAEVARRLSQRTLDEIDAAQ